VPEFGPSPTGIPFGGTQPAISHTMPMPHLSGGQEPGPPPGVGLAAGRKSPWPAVLAGTTALFLVVSLVLGGFLISTNDKLDAANRTIDTRNATISDNEKKLKALREDLDTANDELERKQGENEDLADEKETIAKCLGLLVEFLEAAGRNDQATAQQKLAELQTPCQNAQRLID
jgi:outer membrane murein-binding lipoprotein Lpp